jgi:aspartate/methionine/tyrosine aminotransferase
MGFRKAVAKTLAKHVFDIESVDADHISVLAGAGAVLDVMTLALCEKGDVVLTPAPYYPGFDRDVSDRALCSIFPVKTCEADDFHVTVASLEDAFRAAELKFGRGRVKALLLTNPVNPTGALVRGRCLCHTMPRISCV